ncbi:hypothetical protein [Francisella philomiragia]|uniref:Putative membrane protein n=1 Tax=Francisella philomiragia TaxID=28110 RepID=A0A0B6CQG3_9GAMM|nr:hypothetical protein [Francisella philomiragia]AJI52714.1 putative membrane protein [Francisella philomiragia]MBY7734806.1 hypothetical protein [Francisella philomiragia]
MATMLLVMLIFVVVIFISLLLLSGIESLLNLFIFNNQKHIDTGGGRWFLYVIGIVAVWACIFFYWNVKDDLLEFFEIKDYAFSFFLYLFSGVIAFAILWSMRLYNLDNKKFYDKHTVLTYIFISDLVFLFLFGFIVVPLIAIIGSPDRAGYIINEVFAFVLSLSAIVYAFYLITYLCFKAFNVDKVFKFIWVFFVIYFVSVPTVLLVSKYYVEYKQNNSIYTINFEFEDSHQKFEIKTPGKYLPKWFFRNCNDNLVCEDKNRVLWFEFGSDINNKLLHFDSAQFFSYKGSEKQLDSWVDDSNLYYDNENPTRGTCFYTNHKYKIDKYIYNIYIDLYCKNESEFEEQKGSIKDKIDDLVKQIKITKIN